MTPREFFYPRVALDFYQSMTTRGVPRPTSIHCTIDGRHGILEVRDIVEALQIPYEPADPFAFRQWSLVSSRDMVCILSREIYTDLILLRKKLPPGMLLVDVVLRTNLFPLQHLIQRRGAILDALFRISKGFYFGPHHLIMASLIHFEKKVHRKKLQWADTISLLFPRLLCQILEHMGFPTEPHYECHRIFRERFTVDKWNQLVGYAPALGGHPIVVPPVLLQTKQAQVSSLPTEQSKLPSDSTPAAPAPSTSAHSVPILEATSVVPPDIAPASEPSITISAPEFCALVSTFQTWTTTHAAIFRQLDQIRSQ